MQRHVQAASATASEAERKAIFLEAKTLLGGAAEPDYRAMDLVTRGIHPRFWGMSRAQINTFVQEVRSAVASGDMVNPSLEAAGAFYYPEEKFNAPDIGPNMHLVNSQLIKPRTQEPDHVFGIPFLSFALMVNSGSGGLDCQLFVSHAWDEGCFQFGPFLDEAWPGECSGAYVCFLSNPQHNGELISSLCGSPQASPFFKVLEAGPKRMLMLGNSNTPIHRRLWCVYEAFEGMELGIPTDIAGDKSLLVSNRAAFENMKQAQQKLDWYQHPLRWQGPRSCNPLARKKLTEYSLSMGCGVAAALALLAAFSGLTDNLPSAIPVVAAALLILPSAVLFLAKSIIKCRSRGERRRLAKLIEEAKGSIIDVGLAQCTSADDKQAIQAEIKGKEKDINNFIRDLLVATIGLLAADIVTATDQEAQECYPGGGDDGDGSGDGGGSDGGDGDGGDGGGGDGGGDGGGGGD